MSSIPLLTVFGALQAVPTIIALAQGAKDGVTKGILVAGAVVSTVLAVAPHVDAIENLLSGDLVKVLAVACAVLGVLTLVRVPNRVLGTLATVAGTLSALTALDIVG
jgi:hypothetical protein